MENASKALIIAGTTIIGVMIITIFVYVFREGSKVNEAYDQKQQNNQLELYNSKFEQYNRDNNTIMDMISVCNLAFSINETSKSKILGSSSKEYEYDNTNAIQIVIKIGDANFSIPKVYPDGKIINKNQILYNDKDLKSIYILASETSKELKDEGIDKNLRLENEEDKLTTTKLNNNNKTIYKYLFKCNGINYKTINGQVDSAEFEMYRNDEWDKID